jgi:hypothetical protein
LLTAIIIIKQETQIYIKNKFLKNKQIKLPTKPVPMEAKTPLPKIEKHDLTIGAFRQRKRLRMDITRMAIKLLFGHGSEDGFDDCWIDVIHDLLGKRGNVFTAPVRSHFHKN